MLYAQNGPKKPKMDPYGPHQDCLFIVSPKVHHLGSFRPVWASKQGEISLKSAPNALLWGLRFASDWPPIGLQKALNGPKWPPMAPNSTVCLWSVPLHMIWGISNHFRPDKGVRIGPAENF